MDAVLRRQLLDLAARADVAGHPDLARRALDLARNGAGDGGLTLSDDAVDALVKIFGPGWRGAGAGKTGTERWAA